MLHRDKVDFLSDVWGKIDEVLLVQIRNDDIFDFVSEGSNGFFLQSSDRQDSPSQRDLTGHRYILFHRDTREGGEDGDRHGNAGGRSVLRDGARRDMDMNLFIVQDIGIDLTARLPG